MTDATASAPPTGYDGQGPWLNVGISSWRDAKGVRELFDVMVLVGAYVDEAQARGMERPVGYTFYASSDPDCTPDPNADACDSAQSRIPDEPQPSGEATVSADALASELAPRLKKLGLEPVDISAYQTPIGTAPVVVAQVSDTSAFLRGHPNASLEMFQTEYNSVFYEVVDSSGQPIRAVARSATLGRTISFIPPDLRKVCCDLG